MPDQPLRLIGIPISPYSLKVPAPQLAPRGVFSAPAA